MRRSVIRSQTVHCRQDEQHEPDEGHPASPPHALWATDGSVCRYSHARLRALRGATARHDACTIISVCGLSRVVLVVLAHASPRAGAEHFLFHTPTCPSLGIVVALTLHGQMDMKGRPMGVGS